MGGRVDLFVAGVQKAGTTALDLYLRGHPDLVGALVKETHFFDNEDHDWSAPPYDQLHAHYPPEDGRMRFEATPITLFWPPALARLHHYNPTARIVVLLRDPIERAWSHWSMERRRGTEPLDFLQAVTSGRDRLDLGRLDGALRDRSYVERGFYLPQLRRLLALFPQGQVLCLSSEALRDDPAETLRRLARFAGLAPFPAMPPITANAGDGLAPPEAAVAILRPLYRDDTRAAVTLAGLDAVGWPTLSADGQ